MELKVTKVKRSELTKEEVRELSRNVKNGEMLDIEYDIAEDKYERTKENGSEKEPENWKYAAGTTN